ncbi:MAG: SOS response-associated peptidase [Pseudomonadota bacterium]|nr:SOS response-associated peptidase [Pseudomonadota bacterium]
MCGRYELHSHPAAITLAFGLPDVPDIQSRYNIAPMSEVPVVRLNADAIREVAMLRWGLVPRSAKDPSVGSRMINARGETARERSAFRLPYRWHRCLLPANGFYEWLHVADNPPRKQPLHVTMRHGGLFGLAGLYERWLDPEGHVLDTCTILTTSSNTLLQPYGERMPVIVAPEEYERWLDPHVQDVQDLVVPYPAERMTVHPVSPRVNGTRNEGPELIEPIVLHTQGDEEIACPRIPEQESLF